LSHDGFDFHPRHGRILRGEHSLHLRLRETVNVMENIIVGIVSLGLIVYLFWTLIRPESF
jgi:K+-transporting ATPase KdpF subunit